MFDLTDREWQRIGPIYLSGRGKNGHPSDTRLFVDAVLYILRVGTPWRNLPSAMGTGTRSMFDTWTGVLGNFSEASGYFLVQIEGKI
ncbi:transposase [Solidesulfovibrio sp.]|uniref:transposase n=1 Tax=Solidesulfovibrio sp. TaxID=2910990 RepID=UPI0038B41E9E